MAKIKIIDDDRESAENLAALLEKEGHAVTVSDGIPGAIEDLLEDRPDVLLLDVMFPGNPAGGFDLAGKIRRRRELSQLPVILLTAVNQEFPMNFSAEYIDPEWMPVQDFLDKPAQLPELLAKIKDLQKRPLPAKPCA